MAQSVESLPAVQEMQVPSLGREDPLEKDMAAHCSSPAWEIPRAEEPGGLQSMQSHESDTAEQLNPHHHATARPEPGKHPGWLCQFPVHQPGGSKQGKSIPVRDCGTWEV